MAKFIAWWSGEIWLERRLKESELMQAELHRLHGSIANSGGECTMDDFIHDLGAHLPGADADPLGGAAAQDPGHFSDPDHPFGDAAAQDLGHFSDTDHLFGHLGGGMEPGTHQPFDLGHIGLVDIAHVLGINAFDHLRGLMGISASSTLDPHVGATDTSPAHEHFQPGEHSPGIIGDPGSDMAFWHLQTHDDTCAIVSQEFILDDLTGHHFSEDALRQEAIAHGWYTPGGGTPLDDVGKLLEAHGVHVDHQYGGTLQELADKLQQGQDVIVGVNGEDIWNASGHGDVPLTNYPGIPGQNADHAVEVIGIDDSDPAHPLVILNDPGTPDGQGLEVPAAVFEQAWATSDHYMVSTTDADHHAVGSVPHLGSYTKTVPVYDSEGNWVDNTYETVDD
jgi:hypothetical protein